MSKFYLISIGCSDYQADNLENLKYADKDAQKFYECYRDSGMEGLDEERCYKLFIKPPTITDVGKVLEPVLTEAKPKDTVVFYFAGHGIVDEQNTLFLALHDTVTNGLNLTAISTFDLLKQIGNCRAQRKIIFLDCCHSGAIVGKSRGVDDNKNMLTLLKEHTGKGTVILTSCQESEVAREASDLEQGLFTYHIVEGLKGAADVNDDGVITKDELYQYVSKEFKKRNIPQTPKDISNIGGGSFYLLLSSEKRKEKETLLMNEVGKLLEKRRHSKALVMLDEYPTQPFDLGKIVSSLKENVIADMTVQKKLYRDRLYDEARDNILDEKVQQIIVAAIEKDSNFLFGGNSNNKTEKAIRHHFCNSSTTEAINDLISESMDQIQPVAEPIPDLIPVKKLEKISKKIQPPLNDSGEKNETGNRRKVDYSVVVACVVLLAVMISMSFQSDYFKKDYVPAGEFDKGKMRFGLLLKEGWKESEAKRVFSQLLENINGLPEMIDKGYKFDINNIVTFTTTSADEFIESIIRGDLEVVGEFSPRLIYKVTDLDGRYADPFISPEYAGQPTYETAIFIDTGYSEFNNIINTNQNSHGLDKNIHPVMWEKLIKMLKLGEGEISMMSDYSTSGYWYPRHQVVEAMGDEYLNGSYKFIHKERNEETMLKNIKGNYENVIAGSMAVYKFRELCSNQSNQNKCENIYAVKKIKNIPNGAFMLRKPLSDSMLSTILKNNWEEEVSALIESAGDEVTKKYLSSKSWISVDLSDYKSALNIVAADDIQKSLINKRNSNFVIIAILLAVSVFLMILWAKRTDVKR